MSNNLLQPMATKPSVIYHHALRWREKKRLERCPKGYFSLNRWAHNIVFYLYRREGVQERSECVGDFEHNPRAGGVMFSWSAIKGPQPTKFPRRIPVKEVFSQVHPGINDSKLLQVSMSLYITVWLKYGQLDDDTIIIISGTNAVVITWFWLHYSNLIYTHVGGN